MRLAEEIKPYVVSAEDIALIDAAIEAGEKMLKRGGYEGKFARRGDGVSCITHWLAVDGEGEIVPNSNYACYAGLSSPGLKSPKFIVARIMEGSKDYKLEKGVRDKFIDYIVNRSPYHYAFVMNDTMYREPYGWNVVRLDIPANLISGALTAIRMSWEHRGSVAIIWNKLVDLGVDEDLAYCFSYQVKTNDHKTVILEGKNEWHSAWDGRNFSKVMVYNYIHHFMSRNCLNYDEQAEKTYSMNGYMNTPHNYISYAPICDAWGDTQYGGSWLADKLGDVATAAKGEKKASCNPFNKANGAEQIDIDKFCSAWAGFLMEKAADVIEGRNKEGHANAS